ncbi:hypothetical protein QZH41_016995, partial [Actinostola sp. cb2023]
MIPYQTKLTHRWQCWRGSLKDLEKISIPRCYRPQEFGTIVRAELHAFCDASQDAITAAVYLRLQDDRNQTSVSLVYGQAKVAPLHPYNVSTPDQWRHVESERNPADLPTRGVHPSKLMESDWLHGPTFLRSGADITHVIRDRP